MSMNFGKRRVAGVAALAVGSFLVACAAIGPHTFTLSEAQIAERLSREFPKQQTLFELASITLDLPRVRMLPERNRVATDLEVTAREFRRNRSIKGSISLDYALRFEPSDASIRLAQVHVERFTIDAGDRPIPEAAQHLAGSIAAKALDGATVWRASPAQLERVRDAGVTTGSVNVTERGIEITLGR